jgi:flagellar biosynthesis/type III secretory pathway protein FliH
MTLGDKWRAQGHRAGVREGRKEGKIEGKMEGKIEGKIEGLREILKVAYDNNIDLRIFTNQFKGVLPDQVIEEIVERIKKGEA